MFFFYYAFHNIYYLPTLTKGYIKFAYIFLCCCIVLLFFLSSHGRKYFKQKKANILNSFIYL